MQPENNEQPQAPIQPPVNVPVAPPEINPTYEAPQPVAPTEINPTYEAPQPVAFQANNQSSESPSAQINQPQAQQGFQDTTPGVTVDQAPLEQPGAPVGVSENPDKSYVAASLLSWFFGSLAIDRFYLGHVGIGIAKILTLGGLGVWTLVDQILVTFGKMHQSGNPAPLHGYSAHGKLMKVIYVVMILLNIVFVGLLLTLTIAAYGGIQQRAKDSAVSTGVTSAYKNIVASYAATGYYPSDNQYASNELTYKLDQSTISQTRYSATPSGCDNTTQEKACTGFTLSDLNGNNSKSEVPSDSTYVDPEASSN
jgi:TM2 domain-containing membrane protein YozV